MGPHDDSRAALGDARRLMAFDAATEIQWMIFTGQFRAGDHLRQDQVATMLGMSPTPVREAFVSLASDGLVTLRPHRGVYVNTLTRSRVIEVWEVGTLVTDYIIERAVERRTHSTVSELCELASRLEGAHDPTSTWRLARELHVLIAAMADAPRARAVVESVMKISSLRIFESMSELIEVTKEGARGITDAIAAGDTQQALAAHRAYTGATLERLLEWLEERGVVEPSVPPSA